MPDPHRIKNELQALLSQPQFSSIFLHRNQFSRPGSVPDTPERIAAQTADYLWQKKPLLDPVEIVLLRGPLELYRAYDGGVRKGSAGTLGRSWIERSVAETIWKATAKYNGEDRRRWYMEFLRTANFVLPEWNDMLEIAYMSVPSGASVVVARGRGDWRAMRTPPGVTRPGANPSIVTAQDVMTGAGMMPIPGVAQCVVPLFNDMWVNQISRRSPSWPFVR
jgi:hypothetical protein